MKNLAPLSARSGWYVFAWLTVGSLLGAMLTTILFAIPSQSSAPTPPSYGTYGRLLTEYVTPRGVLYNTWRASARDRDALKAFVTELEATDPSAFPKMDRIALYINLYNAKILEIVLEGNPDSSIKDLSRGFNPYQVFTRKSLDFDGEKISLLSLENRLRRESSDPRIHFAINCASRSCPPIVSEPYRGRSLNAQLEAATRAFLASPKATDLHEKKSLLWGSRLSVSVSKIFSWYSKDFKATGGVVEFLIRFAPEATAERIHKERERIVLEYQAYDWSLNTAS